MGGEGEDWPFAFEAEQTLSLDSTGLSFRLAVTNTDTRSAPIGLGWHPYFPRRPGEVLTFAAGGAWLNGPDLLPTCATDAREWDFGAGRRIGEAEIDNDFYSWDGRAILHADRGARVQLKADPLFGLLRLYTPPGTDFYAVEPVSHRADVINAADAGGGGMAIAAPGETLSGAMTIGAEGGG